MSKVSCYGTRSFIFEITVNLVKYFNWKIQHVWDNGTSGWRGDRPKWRVHSAVTRQSLKIVQQEVACGVERMLASGRIRWLRRPNSIYWEINGLLSPLYWKHVQGRSQQNCASNPLRESACIKVKQAVGQLTQDVIDSRHTASSCQIMKPESLIPH